MTTADSDSSDTSTKVGCVADIFNLKRGIPFAITLAWTF
jgi:hypothetical protein